VFFTGETMRTGRNFQPLSYDMRLPDEAQADALRLLDASRAVVNALLALLWPWLDEFMSQRRGPAWKQVDAMTGSPDPHGDRQFRCESETAGRILRAHAVRKQVFALIQPILTEGFIRPPEGKRPAGKNRKQIKEAITALQQRLSDEDEAALVRMQNVVEQACNYFLIHGSFPACYEEMQAIPLLKVGTLTYAGDDGANKGQSYRLSFDLPAGTASLRFRFPDEAGCWQWKQDPILLQLPACVVERLKEGLPMAPTLRELVKPDGSRVAVLDVIVQVKPAELAAWAQVECVLGFDWGVNTLITAAVLEHTPSDPEHPRQVSRPLFINTGGLDGHQARTRRQIDALKAARDKLAEEDPKRAFYEEEIRRCWRLYEARNRELAHLAANLLLLFAQVWGCALICGESLSTLKTTGRGRGVRGRWRNWRNNTTIRSEIWRILRYKCHLLGLRFRSQRPRGTSHTCPQCGKPAHTYRSPRPEHRTEPVKWGRWLWCAHCGYNGDRDYCAALNIARLGIAFVTYLQSTGTAKAFCVTEIDSVKPYPYIAYGAVPLFPPHTDLHRLIDSGKLYINGWKKSVTLRSSYATPVLVRLCS
jgi:putative transposase